MQCHLVARQYICELCNVILLQGIMSVNYAMPCCLAKRHICELYHAILFLYYSFHLSTMFVYSTALPVHQPFELVMEKSWVKTRSSEQTLLPAEADILLVTDSSSEEESEADDQSYFPLRCMLKLGRVILLISCICCLVMLSFYIIYPILNAICLVDTSYMWFPSAHLLGM